MVDFCSPAWSASQEGKRNSKLAIVKCYLFRPKFNWFLRKKKSCKVTKKQKTKKKSTMPSRRILQPGMFVWHQWDMRPSFVLKCLTCIFWFALKFAMKPRLTPGKQCSLLMGLGGVCVCTKAGDSRGRVGFKTRKGSTSCVFQSCWMHGINWVLLFRQSGHFVTFIHFNS